MNGNSITPHGSWRPPGVPRRCLVVFFVLLAALTVAAGLFGAWTAIHGISARDHPTAARN